MTIKELELEISINDIVNYYYIIEKIKSSIIETRNINTNEKVKFNFNVTGRKYSNIMIVSRNNIIYFRRNSRGGYTHGLKKNKE